MRILLPILILFLAFPVALKAQESVETLVPKNLQGAVRGFVWGLPKEVILENEKGTLMEEQKRSIFFLDYIRGLKSTIAYEFLNEKLWRVKIFIEKQYLDNQQRIRDLMMISENLTMRYGAPVSEDFLWLKDTEKDYPDSWGWAVYRGDLKITMMWQNEETIVTAHLGAQDKYKPELSVTYVDRKTKTVIDDLAQKKLIEAPILQLPE